MKNSELVYLYDFAPNLFFERSFRLNIIIAYFAWLIYILLFLSYILPLIASMAPSPTYEQRCKRTREAQHIYTLCDLNVELLDFNFGNVVIAIVFNAYSM